MSSRIDGSGNRAHALRMQRIMAKLRQQDSIDAPPAAASNGLTAARRAAEHAGVGDNLEAALKDAHTEDNPVAPSFVQALSKDSVMGDGNVEPTAVASSGHSRSAARRGSAVQHPLAAAEQARSALVASGSLAAQLQAGEST